MRPGLDTYAASKVAVSSLSRTAALEAIAVAAVWLASQAASFMVGQDMVVGGGASA